MEVWDSKTSQTLTLNLDLKKSTIQTLGWVEDLKMWIIKNKLNKHCSFHSLNCKLKRLSIFYFFSNNYFPGPNTNRSGSFKSSQPAAISLSSCSSTPSRGWPGSRRPLRGRCFGGRGLDSENAAVVVALQRFIKINYGHRYHYHTTFSHWKNYWKTEKQLILVAPHIDTWVVAKQKFQNWNLITSNEWTWMN